MLKDSSMCSDDNDSHVFCFVLRLGVLLPPSKSVCHCVGFSRTIFNDKVIFC